MELLILLGLVGVAGAFVGLTGDDDDPAPEEDPANPDFLSINGTARAEELEGTEGQDSVYGSGGDDLIQTFAGNDILRGGSGEDTLEGGSGNDTILGGRGDEDAHGGEGDDSLDGGEGRDALDGDDGDDILTGGEGNDRLDGGNGDDTLWGGTDADYLRGRAGDDSLDGGDGDDRLTDLIGENTLFGGAGNDTISAGRWFTTDPTQPATHLIDGGSGDDFIVFADNSTVTGGSGADRFLMDEDMRNDTTSRIEDFDPDEDSLTINVLTQGSSGDGFSLIARPDGLGNDLYLDDNLVVEILSTKSFTLADMNISVQLLWTPDGTSTHTIGPNDAETGIGFTASIGDDSITGTAGDDVLRGALGSDTLVGGDGNDALFGNSGSDELRGDAGDDTLHGEGHRNITFVDGNQVIEFETDTLDGGDGDDLLIMRSGHVATGGDGSDVFGIAPAAIDPAFTEQFPPTIITDFNPAEDFVVLGPTQGAAAPAPADITVSALADGTGAEVLINDRVVAIVYGGQDLTADDIQIGDANFTGDYRTP